MLIPQPDEDALRNLFVSVFTAKKYVEAFVATCCAVGCGFSGEVLLDVANHQPVFAVLLPVHRSGGFEEEALLIVTSEGQESPDGFDVSDSFEEPPHRIVATSWLLPGV